MRPEDEYLWDRSGTPDPVVARLESLLAPLRHDPARAPLRQRSRRQWPWWLGAVAAAGIAAWWLWGSEPSGPQQPQLQLLADGRALQPDEWIETAGAASALELGDGIGRLRLAPGSRLQLRKLAREETRLFLQVGRLEAFVAADARPRFFQVETPATTCVDLGCKYVLSVDADGTTHVQVTLGQVAFESADGERYIPMGAECLALGAGRLGTPRFRTMDSTLVDLLDEFDRADRADGARRRELADKFCSVAAEPKTSLSIWHWLSDPDPGIRTRADAALAALFDPPAERTPAAWKEQLESWWY